MSKRMVETRSAEPIGADMGTVAARVELDAKEALSTMIGIVRDATFVGNDIQALVYLFDKAVVDDGEDTDLTAASHLVISCLKTMAERLRDHELRAQAVYAPFVARARN